MSYDGIGPKKGVSYDGIGPKKRGELRRYYNFEGVSYDGMQKG